ncbi:MAG: translation initiation factor IF-2, partial [Candidatus Subteraquimicrobiales bacterium]|nr:translation initiation factor IF-2 [Candidatus Subteraquimicrobiales bacterium]
KLEELGKSAPDASFILDDETVKELTKNASPKNEPKTLKELIIIREGTTVKDFAELVKKNPADIIKKLIALGEMTTINQPLSNEAINVLADELGYEVTIVSPTEEITQEMEEVVGDLEHRPPVVTVMGHVDHGKTSLLDAIRKTNIIATEAGGITQHIGAYQVLHHGKKITFIDTPGHEAFTAMRARGAKVTDVAVLVIAADDGVMPQTVEAIDHARAAKVPIIVTINKIDKPNANPEKIKQQLTEYELVSEEWGGSTVFVEISAKLGTNIEELLEMILLTAELQELKASLKAPTKGFIIEAKLDRGRGPVATALIQQGKLRVGDAIISGAAHGKVRALTDDQGNPVEEATPSMPTEVIGFSSVPHAGDEIRVVADEKIARQITEERALKLRVIEREKQKKLTLGELF